MVKATSWQRDLRCDDVWNMVDPFAIVLPEPDRIGCLGVDALA